MESKMTKLERLRRDAGLTQEALAEKSGVSRGVIVRIENGGIGKVLGKNMKRTPIPITRSASLLAIDDA